MVGGDTLTCGVCSKDFALADIVQFIQHKAITCNKENYQSEKSNCGNNAKENGENEENPSSPPPNTPRSSTPAKDPADDNKPELETDVVKSEANPTFNNNNNNNNNNNKRKIEVVDAHTNTANNGK